MPKKKTTEMITFSVVLPADTMAALQRLADADNRPRAQMARLLLTAAIKNTAEKKRS